MECTSTMRSRARKIIGVVGGVGPFAGLDLNKKIFDNTRTIREQDHLDVYLLSSSSRISDRTEYLLDPDGVENPAAAVCEASMLPPASKTFTTPASVP